jgi:hypothetical protein
MEHENIIVFASKRKLPVTVNLQLQLRVSVRFICCLQRKAKDTAKSFLAQADLCDSRTPRFCYHSSSVPFSGKVTVRDNCKCCKWL